MRTRIAYSTLSAPISALPKKETAAPVATDAAVNQSPHAYMKKGYSAVLTTAQRWFLRSIKIAIGALVGLAVGSLYMETVTSEYLRLMLCLAAFIIFGSLALWGETRPVPEVAR